MNSTLIVDTFSNGVSSCFPWRDRSLPMDRVDVLRLLLRHTPAPSEDERKGDEQILWPWLKTNWVHFNKCARGTMRCWSTLHKWVLIIHKKLETFYPAPFIFGPWTSTSYCNETCGTNRFKLELRTCNLVNPNLPSNISCQNQLTLRTGDSRCPPSKINCTGKIEYSKQNKCNIAPRHRRAVVFVEWLWRKL